MQRFSVFKINVLDSWPTTLLFLGQCLQQKCTKIRVRNAGVLRMETPERLNSKPLGASWKPLKMPYTKCCCDVVKKYTRKGHYLPTLDSPLKSMKTWWGYPDLTLAPLQLPAHALSLHPVIIVASCSCVSGRIVNNISLGEKPVYCVLSLCKISLDH